MPKGNEVAAQSGKTLNKLRGSLILEIRKKNELNENPTVFIYLSISEYGSPCCGISNSVGCDWRLLAGAVQLHGKYIYISMVYLHLLLVLVKSL